MYKDLYLKHTYFRECIVTGIFLYAHHSGGCNRRVLSSRDAVDTLTYHISKSYNRKETDNIGEESGGREPQRE